MKSWKKVQLSKREDWKIISAKGSEKNSLFLDSERLAYALKGSDYFPILPRKEDP
jgi:hypothetical protein